MNRLTADQLRKSILQLAIQGKIVKQNPDDEPASELVKRIYAEKQKLIAEGKIKKDKNESYIYKGDDNHYYEKIGTQVRDITEELPFEIPKNWTWVRLSHIIFIQTGASFKKEQSVTVPKNNYIRVLRGGNILPFSINLKNDDLFIPQTLINKNIMLQKNDIITPAVTSLENIGKLAVFNIDLSEEITAGGFVYIFRPYINNNIISNYITYAMYSPVFNLTMKEITKKSGQAFYNMNKERLCNLYFPVPPLQEQERIVEKINSMEPMIAEYDKLEKELYKLDSEFKDKLKKSVLQYAIQGKLVKQDENDEPASVLLEKIRAEKKAQLGKKYVDSYIYKGDDNCYYEYINKKVEKLDNIPFSVPNEWNWCRLDNLAIYRKGPFGSSLTKNMFVPKSENSVKVYEQKNAIYKNIELGNYYISLEKFNTMKSFEVFPKDIIVSCAGTIGETFVLPDNAPKGIINQALMRIKLFNQTIVDFYLLYFDYILKIEARDNSKGSAIKNIPPFEILKKMYIPIPPIEEQNRIVNKIEKIFNIL